ncbi:MAG: hypothetical protein N4Q79_05675 [Lactobacillus iners]|nr:hypothetical protein [Lactobacillus crispatus]MCT7811103.1 hypothetical protein [Lactobacillus iners]MCT7838875.1 hypothetical protein [Lactobacillus iners]
MMEILKNLANDKTITAIIVLGLARETRLFLKTMLEYKLQNKKLDSRKNNGG